MLLTQPANVWTGGDRRPPTVCGHTPRGSVGPLLAMILTLSRHVCLSVCVSVSLSRCLAVSLSCPPARGPAAHAQVLQQVPQQAAVYGMVEAAATAVSITVDGGSEAASYTVAAALKGGEWKAVLKPTAGAI